MAHNFISIDSVTNIRDVEALKEALKQFSAFEIADFISQKKEWVQVRIFEALSDQVARETFDFLSVPMQRKLVKALSAEKGAHLLASLSPDDRTDFLQDLPRKTIDELVSCLPVRERTLTQTLLGYPENSIGRLMIPYYLCARQEWTIENALRYIQTYGPDYKQDSEILDVIYVVDDEGVLLDQIKIQELLFSNPEAKVSDIMTHNTLSLPVNQKIDFAVGVFRQHNRMALPVVDDENIILGVVTIDDILRLANKTAVQEIQKIGGTVALDIPYMQSPFFTVLRKRIAWLIVFFLAGSLTGTVISFFKTEISKAIYLAFFLPLIISIGNSAGSQASTLIISALSSNELKLSDWWRVLRREFFSGLLLGAFLALLAVGRMSILDYLLHFYGEHAALLGLMLSLSIVSVVLCGTLLGAILPLLFQAAKLDPAYASTPFVSSIISVCGLLIYFTIAYVTLHGTLL